MDFELSEEQQQIRATVADFADCGIVAYRFTDRPHQVFAGTTRLSNPFESISDRNAVTLAFHFPNAVDLPLLER